MTRHPYPSASAAVPTPGMGVLPTSLRVPLQTCPRDKQQEGLYFLKALGRMGHGKDSTKPRDEVLHPHAVKDNLLTTLRWPIHSRPLGPLRAVPYVPWPDYIKEPGPNMKTCSLPMWAQCLDTWDVDSSVSSGRISGSSGGHESCALSHGPWKERPPLVLGPQHQPRKSNPRLEQLRDKIRAQARWQASCASLGTSVPPSASCFFKTSTVRRKTPKVTNALPVPNCRGQWLLCSAGILRAAEYRDKDRTPLSLGRERSRGHHTSVPRTNIKRIKSAACRREIPKSSVPCRTPKGRGFQKKTAAVEDPAAHTCLSKPTCAHSDPQVSEHTPSLAFHEQSATIQGAMDILHDLRQQIQAGLELARSPRLPRKLSPSKPKPQNLPGKRQRGPQSTRDLQGFSESAWTVPKGKRSFLDRTVNLHGQQHWKEALPEQESYLQRAWTAQGQDTSFQRSGNTPEKQNPFSQRPWSALAGQACSRRTFTACKDWEVSEPSPPSSLARPHSALRQPWSSSFVQRSRPYSKGKSAVPPPSKVKLAWPEPAQGIPQSKPGKEQDTQEAPPCPGPRGSLGQTHSSESLHAFMRQKAQARRQHAMEQKALAAHTLELRNQRLQEVYRKQREAVLGKTIHVVSQRRPGIVTFVPSAIQSGGLEAPGSPETPLQKWSKVTSGMVLGDQEAPDSFCLCLNKPWTRSETQDARHPPEGVSGAPLIPSTTYSPDPMKLQALPWGLSIYLGPQDAEHLGPSGLLHFQYKQARLQALETMADALKQRIDILTTKLHKPTSPDTAGDPASDMLGSSKTPATPTLIPPSYFRTLMPQGGRGTPQDWVDGQAKPLLPSTCFQDSEMLPWRPSWETQSPNLGTHMESQRQGPVSSPPASVSQVIPHSQPYPAGSSHGASSKDAIEERHWELEKKLQRKMATLQALGACMRSSLGVPAAPDPTGGSFWQEEMPEAKKTDLVTPWTTQSCGKGEPADRPWAGWSGGQGGLLWASSTA
ncbi:coiled-coil domain-containing protein 187-like [Acomys russatus]|uniref:coiled-coil domain-containing protein 187-like n=1 Tax=Acomys russatus TaxID=60746 RepID=UPI0021E33B3B|nr:coiled-coil domain-containing protein 187-like [Acomys russatus]